VKIAVIGAGISGLSCAWRLSRSHEVTLYEANDYLGGHTHTVMVELDSIAAPVDTGFLVFNHRTYPNLVRLFDELGVATAKSDMSFSARILGPAFSHGELEWAGTDLNSVFAQRRNLLSPRFLRMLADILRFNRQATQLASKDDAALADVSLGSFIERHGYSTMFRDAYLLPMAAAIWSCPTGEMLAFPVATFIRFCHNHGLLQVSDRPQWYTVVGGGREYVKKLATAITVVKCAEPVRAVTRAGAPGSGVKVQSATTTQHFDEVVLACHSDQARAVLADISDAEDSLLSAVRYQPNHAILHTDSTVLPRRRRAWAAWNYQYAPHPAGAAKPEQSLVCVHYLINKLQPVPFKRPLILSLNPFERPPAASIVQEFDYAHPVFDAAAIAAQTRLGSIQGVRHTWFCGAWNGYGFHEDGLKSGLAVAAAIEQLSGVVAPRTSAVAPASALPTLPVAA
jgi:predicted NAD/FAD-binding protein